MEIKKEIVEDFKTLSEEDKNKLAIEIVANWSKFDQNRNSQIAMARKIMEETYLNQPKRKFGKDLEWKSDVKLNAVYNIKRTKKASLWREIWSNPSQMFDVRGTNEQTEKQAKLQKAAIVDSLEKMEIGKQYDSAIDNLFDIGEMIFKTDWVQRKKIVKRQQKNIGFMLMNVFNALNGAGFQQAPLKDVEIPYYENARVESISPFLFVFDSAKYRLKNKDSWDSIIKIYKRFDTLENIKDNFVYSLSQNQIDELNKNKENKSGDNKEEIDLRDSNKNSGEYSILFAHGDFEINGKVYKNYIAEVLAEKFLIRFEENPMLVNPFILCALEFDPLTKRGISPLKSVFDMCKIEEDLTNTAFDVQKLSANPPCWVNEDLVNENNSEKNGSIIYEPGKFLKYKNNYDGSLPKEAAFSANGISDLLGLLNQKISDVSSVSSVMYGNIENSRRTATELSLADKGSSSQVGKELDIINQDFTIPMIKNVAELLATFKDGIDYVYTLEKGKNVEYKITNSIRQAEYNYIYEDRNAIHDRRAKFQELYQLFQGAAQLPDLAQMIDWKEVLTTAVEMIGFDNTDKFFTDGYPAQQFSNMLKQLPQELQQQIVPILQQQTQQLVGQFQQQQQQAQLQVQNDMYRQQVRQDT